MTVPANIRFNLNAPFPSLVTGSGPITVSKMNGIWKIGYSVANLAKQPTPPAATVQTGFVTVWDSQSNLSYNLPLGALATPVLLNTLVANNSPNLTDITSLGLGYNEYSFVFENILPANNGVDFEMQVAVGGTFQTTNGTYINSAGGQTNCIDILQAATLSNDGTFAGFSGAVTMFGKPGATSIKQVRGVGTYVNTGAGASNSNCAGWYNTAAALTGVRFGMVTSAGVASGNIVSGTIKVYGSL